MVEPGVKLKQFITMPSREFHRRVDEARLRALAGAVVLRKMATLQCEVQEAGCRVTRWKMTERELREIVGRFGYTNDFERAVQSARDGKLSLMGPSRGFAF